MTSPYPVPEKPGGPYDYGVYKPHPALPFGALGELDGKWYFLEDVVNVVSVGNWPVVPTDRYVERSDGARAQVFEVGP